MAKIIFKILSALFFWGIFVYVVLQIPYPETLTQANIYQAAPFFVSLFFAFAFSLNIFLKNLSLSLALSLGIIFLLILKALDSLNIVTGILTVAAIYLLVSSFKKVRVRNPTLNSGFKNLTRKPKIPGLKSFKR